NQFFFRLLAGQKNATGVLQSHRAKQLFFTGVVHEPPPSAFAASSVPSTRALILANAVPRVVEVSSQKGEKPQSSVVPNCSTGIYRAASRTRSRISSGVSTRGSIGEVTPTKMRCSGLI